MPLRICLVAALLSLCAFLNGCSGGSSSSSSSSGGGGSTPTSFTVTSVTPANVAAGATTVTVTVTGTGFTSSTSIQVGGVVETTTYVSATQLTASVPASQLASGGLLTVIALNGGSTTASGTVVNLEVDNPVPAITTFTPSTFVTGAAATVVNVTGSGFIPTTALQVNGTSRSTTYVSATQLSLILTAADLATAGSISLKAVNPTPGGGTSSASSIAVNNAAPTLSSLTPLSVVAGSTTTTTVTVMGANFIAATTVQVGSSSRSATIVSPTQLTFPLTVADQAQAGSLSITVVNPSPGGGSSSPSAIVVSNPAPTLISLTPVYVPAGATSPATITVFGTNFVSSTTVLVGSSSRGANIVSSTQLTFALTVADQAATAKLSIMVVNSSPGGGSSVAAPIYVVTPSPTPILSSVSPTSFVAGSPASIITVNGTNISATTIVLWNGTPLATTIDYSYSPGIVYYAVATVPASLLTAFGTPSIATTTPTALQPLSNALSVSIVNPPVPVLNYIIPSTGPTNMAQTIELSGSNFTTASTATVNGVSIPVTFVSSGYLTITVPAVTFNLPGNYNIIVNTAAPGGGTSAAVPFTAYIGIPNNSMVYNPVNGLFYVSVPSLAGPPYGNSVVSVDPQTGALGTPIPVGSEPDKLAISSDGTIIWVGLNGAAAVRQVNLTTGTAGLEFSMGGNSGDYATPPAILALAALPGSPNSVVVSTFADATVDQVAIFDSGVIRGTPFHPSSPAYALQVDGSKSEIYTEGVDVLNTFTYNATGMTPKLSYSAGNFTDYESDDVQLAGGVIYAQYGGAYNAETGALLGTFSSSGTAANGPTFTDTALGKTFYLTNAIQVFNSSTYADLASIPFSVTTGSAYDAVEATPSHLSRWGTNGLAIRTSDGVYTLQSNLVKDVSATPADLGITIAASGTNSTGSNTTYTATVTNSGPSPSTNITFTASLPSTAVFVSAQSSAGPCANSNTLTCDLGGLASGTSATVTIKVQQVSAGSAIFTASVAGSENDPNSANNQASSTTNVTGSTYNLTPVITSLVPASILSGSTATTLTVNGTGFASASAILVGGSTLPTTFVSSTQLMAVVPAAALSTLGWTTVSVLSPTPGGGTAPAVPLAIYSLITLAANHILYDPYSRNIMASVATGSSPTAGDSIVAITPQTATVGTPVSIGSQPTNLALTSDGQILYTILSGTQSIARFNMLTQSPDFTYTPSANSYPLGLALNGIATQPGTENTIALDLSDFSGNAIYDFNPTTKTAAIRGQNSYTYSGTCAQFVDSADLIASDDSSTQAVDHYIVTSSGFALQNNQQYSTSTLYGSGCFKISGGLAFRTSGTVANPATIPATQLGIFPGVPNVEFNLASEDVAPDTSLQRVFYVANTTQNPIFNAGAFDGVGAYDANTFLLASKLTLNVPASESAGTNFSPVDLVRWGQDGLALLTNTGHIYLVRGPLVVPQLMNANSAAVLTSNSSSSIAHGTGNTLLTLTGSNFIPGVAVTWNGSYRTTTIVDATHVTVAIPASDLAATGSASLVATNPGASASAALAVIIN